MISQPDDRADPGGKRAERDGAGLSPLSSEELQRYQRHLTLPNVGVEGQHRLRAARVLIVGAGGLGSPAALYLAAAGVGTLGIVDSDEVELSNLQRQILHASDRVGARKTDSARRRIAEVNPHVRVEPFDTRITSGNAREIVRGFDIVLDGSDNFPTRYLLNDVTVLERVPNIYGSIHRFEGQVSVFGLQGGPCYRCLFRDPPPAGAVQNCDEAGVFGVLPGIVGTIQATEAIKLLLGVGEPLSGRLLLMDTLTMAFRTVEVRRDPDCPSCGSNATGELIDYELLCGVAEAPGEAAIGSIAPAELARRLERGDDIDLVDVRQPYEWEIAHIAGARLVPLDQLDSELASFDPGRETVLYCRTGGRSMRAAQQLAAGGIRRLANLEGGLMRWRQDVDPEIPRY